MSDRYNFDGERPVATPKQSAAVILVREPTEPAESSQESSTVVRNQANEAGELEVFLLRRSKRAGFMASAFVFPGGIEEPEDNGDLRVTAARELFEEAGILLAKQPIDETKRLAMRARVAAGEIVQTVLEQNGVDFNVGALSYFSHWLTPSAEKRRYSAQFFVAQIPAGQVPQFDNVETVQQTWVTPTDALSKARELRLPPPQLRTFSDMQSVAGSWDALVEDAERRSRCKTIFLPRFAPLPSDAGDGPAFALLLPWDRDYDALGIGEGIPIASDHSLATGPSRFVLEDETWKNINAPSSSEAEST